MFLPETDDDVKDNHHDSDASDYRVNGRLHHLEVILAITHWNIEYYKQSLNSQFLQSIDQSMSTRFLLNLGGFFEGFFLALSSSARFLFSE